jgi:hypothetical protein
MRNHIYQNPQVFVFGSNLGGLHFSGAAKFAIELPVGPAIMGIGEGRVGFTYALPTCDLPGHALPLRDVLFSIYRFLDYAKLYPSVEYFMTRVGCGIAGFTDEQIAPPFTHAVSVMGASNLILPPEWDNL